MNVTGGTIVTVYRTTKDRFGDKSNDTPIGTIDGCVLDHKVGVGQYTKGGGFAETAVLETLLWAPTTAEIKLQHRDRITMDGRKFQVSGDRLWDTAHPATGTRYSHYAVQVEAVM